MNMLNTRSNYVQGSATLLVSSVSVSHSVKDVRLTVKRSISKKQPE